VYLGRVLGSAVATVKHPSLEGCKLLLVMALQADGRSIEGDPILAIDTLGAGHGETVMITSDGIGAREMVHCPTSPIRWSVLGIPDRTVPR
jgi:ethanolamine utilization protein EutN